MSAPILKIIAITIGDINGIGPEVTLKALRQLPFIPAMKEGQDFRVAIIGPAAALQFWQTHLRLNLPIPHIKNLDAWPKGTSVVVLDTDQMQPRIQIGQLSAAAGKIAGEALAQAIRLAREEKVHAIVTAPVSKQALHLAGFHYPGQTEFLAEGLGAADFAMMLVAEEFRVALVTTHLPLREVAAAISQDLILRRLRVLHHDLQTRFRIVTPRIAVTGLNPHAGEGGVLGEEEQTLIAPAIRSSRDEGIAAEGPFSADALFGRLKQNRFDAYLAMYHDQGLIPLKMFGFGRAVNYTAGLPVIRTSPDHGTAFDIAGKGLADPTSMVEALRLATALLSQN
ncbi:MAG: 4-hydroxythreonine-4-phosphate dehydrogenase PdxA [candidate division KSB1 bacterium]|nr:4-hydroxythreonine-4-phosphate dehydrogenase PdxA [candidate division KSB1 bacterium]MDZ7304076.1 4-hydroxythreonine-4-phosphate dehydrogenase PdxA [candidate division KSB1 bacterium]MDZ7312056.1 4-hydroxythreonine-4-phosphate dehydrogenase PdxA [candidate division KSB1 bacterium]